MKIEIRRLCLSALFCVFCILCSVIALPTPFGVPLSLAPFGFCLLGLCLPLKNSLLVFFTYLLAGICGLPVFSSFTGGIGVLLGQNGGFIMGFLAIVVLCNLSKGLKASLKIPLCILGVVICHAFGVIYLSLLTDTPFFAAFSVASAPFLFKDFLLLGGALLLQKRVAKFV